MEVLIYTTQGCMWCSRAKELMQRANLEYTEVSWRSLSEEEQAKVKEQYPSMDTFPGIIIDGEFIGGLVQVAKLFLDKGIVSSRRQK